MEMKIESLKLQGNKKNTWKGKNMDKNIKLSFSLSFLKLWCMVETKIIKSNVMLNTCIKVNIFKKWTH